MVFSMVRLFLAELLEYTARFSAATPTDGLQGRTLPMERNDVAFLLGLTELTLAWGPIFDGADNIYGTTTNNNSCCGVVYQLTPSGTVNVLYAFPYPGTAGYYPWNGVVFDNSGNPDNIYGTTLSGGLHQYGTVFHLTCGVGGCQESLLHSFSNGSDGGYPYAGVIFDSGGDLYGAASDGGTGGGGTVFELSPPTDWSTLTVLYSFTGTAGGNCPNLGYPGPGPWASLTMDATGNLYGTTSCDGAYGYGNVFELTYSNGTYTYEDLYDFTGGNDGAYPISNVLLHKNGNLYGTASAGGSQGVGVVGDHAERSCQ